MSNFSPGIKRYQARMLDNAILLRDALDKISAGQWPTKTPQKNTSSNPPQLALKNAPQLAASESGNPETPAPLATTDAVTDASIDVTTNATTNAANAPDADADADADTDIDSEQFEVTWTLDRLADAVARQRLYRAGLAAIWTMQTRQPASPSPAPASSPSSAPIPSPSPSPIPAPAPIPVPAPVPAPVPDLPATITLESIRAPWLPSGTTATAFTHPVTNAALRLEQRGKATVLVLTSSQSGYAPLNPDGNTDLVWRLPRALTR
jgi:hypothetical protein